MMEESSASDSAPDATANLSGLKCPLVVLRTKKALTELEPGQRLLVIATDPSSRKDIPAFAELAGYRLLLNEEGSDGQLRFVLER